MGGFLSKIFKMVTEFFCPPGGFDATLASITKAANTAASYLSALPRAAASSYEAAKSAATAASRKVVDLVTQVLGSRAATAVKGMLDEVTRAVRHGVSSLAAAVQKAVAAVLDSVKCIPTEVKIAVAVVAVAAGLCLAFCCVPSGGGAAAAGAMMMAPGGGGLMIVRKAFEANAWLYFSLLRAAGPAAAVAAFL